MYMSSLFIYLKYYILYLILYISYILLYIYVIFVFLDIYYPKQLVLTHFPCRPVPSKCTMSGLCYKAMAAPWCGRGTESFSHVQEDTTGDDAGKTFCEVDGGVSSVATSVLWPNRCPHDQRILDSPQNFSGVTQRSLIVDATSNEVVLGMAIQTTSKRPKIWALSGDMCIVSSIPNNRSSSLRGF